MQNYATEIARETTRQHQLTDDVQERKLEPTVETLPFARPVYHVVHLEVGLVARLVGTYGAMVKSNRVRYERYVHLDTVKDTHRAARRGGGGGCGGGARGASRSGVCPTTDKKEQELTSATQVDSVIAFLSTSSVALSGRTSIPRGWGIGDWVAAA